MITTTLTNLFHRRKAVWGPKRTLAVAAMLALGLVSNASAEGRHIRQAQKANAGTPSRKVKNYKLDDELTNRSARNNPLHTSSVIVTLVPGAQLPREFKKYARAGKLDLINGFVLDVPNRLLKEMAAHPNVFRIHEDRPIKSHNYLTSVTVGARTVKETLGYTGAGIGIAVIDSGVTTWHDDLTNKTSTLYPYGNQRVKKFVDFVNGQPLPYDDNGHGSHVAGIILGNGSDSYGEKSGVAPGAALVSLKVLDANGLGTISNIIAALNWVAANGATYNIRVVNMSVGAQIRESYWTDPLTLAVKQITDKGITVVCAAGNFGKNALGNLQWGGITAPANAPWVLTVGASSTMGTLTRNDDTMASYSSSGPTRIDFDAKPDLVAPGTGTVSLAVPGSTFYTTKAAYLLNGKGVSLATKPYLSLSGTSMAAPVVAGSVALMLQANPNLTPNLIKAILQYTAQEYPGYKALRQGAGFLNTLGAVRLAKFYANNKTGARIPVQKVWSKQVLWGNHRLTGGYLNPKGNAWAGNVVWGAARTLGDTGDNIVWGTVCADCDNIVWGTADASGDNIVWGTALVDNIVWGTAADGDNIVWGTAADGDNIVWGTAADRRQHRLGHRLRWRRLRQHRLGHGRPARQHRVGHRRRDGDNIVWGTSTTGDNIVWGTSDDVEAVVYPDSADQLPPPSTAEFGDPTESSTVTDPGTGVATTTVTDLVTGATVSTTVTDPTAGTTSVTSTDATTGVTTTTVTTTVTDPVTGATTTTVATTVTGGGL